MIGWLDASAGASGDMLLGALVDAGVPLAYLRSTVDTLALDVPTLHAEPASRHGLGATRVRVRAPSGTQPHRGLSDIRTLLRGAALPVPVREAALAAFELLGTAEAAVHRTDPDRVHFHEVGALDAIADVVAGCAGVHWLREEQGLTELTVGPLEAGSAAPAVPAGHGAVPVPVPAVVEIAARTGMVLTGRLPYEACTPTGAALLATLTSRQGPMPPMAPVRTGLGAGGRDPAEAPNVLRLLLGRAGAAAPDQAGPTAPDRAGAGEPAVLLECNVDDLDPRLWPVALAALLEAGASDAWLTPILMKKGRPAHTLHALCPPGTVEAVRDVVFAHTTTIGLRATPLHKYPLERRTSTVDVDGQPVAVKVAFLHGRVVNASVEFEDVVRAAHALGRTARTVLAQANAAARGCLPSDRHEEGE